MVLVMMDLHGLLVDVGLQRVKCVGQRGNGKCHSVSFSSLIYRQSRVLFQPANPPAFSKASARRNMPVSSKCRVSICMPTGNPSDVFPHGTLMQGIPARSPVIV